MRIVFFASHEMSPFNWQQTSTLRKLFQGWLDLQDSIQRLMLRWDGPTVNGFHGEDVESFFVNRVEMSFINWSSNRLIFLVGSRKPSKTVISRVN